MQVLWHTGYLVLFAITAGLPQSPITALAAFTAGLRLESILFLPAIALNMTASILVGHSLGRGDFQGAKGIGYRIWGFGVLGISIMGAGLWLFAPALADILSQKPAVAAEIVSYLHFNILAIPFTATTMIFGGVFIGAGATRYNMLAIGGTVWLVRLPLAYGMGHHLFGQATGIWAAMLLSQVVQATLMFVLFSVKNWYRFSLQAQKLARKTNGVRHAAHLPTAYSGRSNRL
jgi:Na+-driven multidrug efflux pump